MQILSYGFFLSKYILASVIMVSPLISSVMVSSSESCDINVSSIFLFVIIIAVLLHASPAVNVLYFESIPAILPW